MRIRRILGLDVLPGSSPSSTKDPSYAYALLVDGALRETGEVRRSLLPEKLDKHRVDALAIDNVYELGDDVHEIVHLVKAVHHIPRIIQVTLVGGKAYKISSLARSLGLSNSKLDPYKTAEVAAQLAYMGIGSELVLFEEETRVTVSKGRTPSQGGMSLERYRRNVEQSVLLKTREIKDALDNVKADYDLFIVKGKYGLERSVFVVYLPRHRLYGVVKPSATSEVTVCIEAVEKNNPTFVPLYSAPSGYTAAERGLIVGIDPGTTTGLAALTLDGELVLLSSNREFGRGEATRVLARYGRAAVVATDVASPSIYARKLASALNAKLFSPARSLTVEEKRELVYDFIKTLSVPLKVRDSHQRDALAAAVYAYRHYKPKLEEARSKLRKIGLNIPFDEVAFLVLRDTPIWQAIKSVSQKYLLPRLESPRASKPDEEEMKRMIEEMSGRIVELHGRIAALERERSELLNRLSVLENELDRVISLQSRSIKEEIMEERLRRIIEDLQAENKKLSEKLNEVASQKSALVDTLSNVATGRQMVVRRYGDVKSLALLQQEQSAPRVVALPQLRREELEHISRLVNRGCLKAVICEGGVDEDIALQLAYKDVVALSIRDFRKVTRPSEDLYVLDSEEFYERLNAKLEELRLKSGRALAEKVRQLLEDYRAERLRAYRLKNRDLSS